jgi:acetaldehyde dehydrogenase (acetylating)
MGEPPMLEITAIRLVGGEGHEHITDVRWHSASSSAGQSTRAAIVEWLSVSRSNHAAVVNGPERVAVAVVPPSNEPPYIRACAEGAWTDHLLALPTF